MRHHLVRLFVAADLGWWAAIAGLLSALTTILIRSLGSLSKWNYLFFFLKKEVEMQLVVLFHFHSAGGKNSRRLLDWIAKKRIQVCLHLTWRVATSL